MSTRAEILSVGHPLADTMGFYGSLGEDRVETCKVYWS